ncbi:MAG: PAS domain S-box-containing protein [Nitrospinales bacterium]|jgi:PAS domain S-box-containing protein
MKSDSNKNFVPQKSSDTQNLNKLILESVGDGIYGLDTEGRTTFVNKAAERMTGFTAEEMIGKPQHKLVHHSKPDGKDYPREQCPIYSAFTDGKVHRISNEVFWRKDGTPFPVEYVSTPIREHGKLVGAVVVFKDITERKQTEHALYLNKLVLDSAGEGVLGLCLKGTTTFVNHAAEKMTGYSAQEIIGKPQHKLLHHTKPDGSDYPREECPIYAAFNDGKVHKVSNEVFWKKDGTSFPVEYTSTPIRENLKLLGAVVVFRDITERIQAEEEIQDLRNQLELENAYLNEEFLHAQAYGDIIGNSPALETILRQIEMVGPTDANVLITGESGTGKELVAREIHNRSSRRKRTMIKVNCSSIPKELYESEFFGHVKGAFTGAIQDRAGRFSLADGGTLFLDEIGEVPLDLQSKLLRVLQEGTFERIGDEKTLHADVRIIAATNRSLKEEVESKNFRQDLYYRLNVFPIEVPPLRDRKEDIPLLASNFIKLIAKKLNRPLPKITQANMMQLKGYDWPGNIRELQNVIERAMITSRSGKLLFNLSNTVQIIKRKGLEINPKEWDTNISILTEEEMKLHDRQNILNALNQCGWKITGSNGAAEILGMRPTTLHSKIKKLGIKRPD